MDAETAIGSDPAPRVSKESLFHTGCIVQPAGIIYLIRSGCIRSRTEVLTMRETWKRKRINIETLLRLKQGWVFLETDCY